MSLFKACCEKYSTFAFSEIVFLYLVLPRQQGRIAIVTTREAGCDGRGVSQHVFHMRTNGMTRTAKSCGPDLPVLRSAQRAECALSQREDASHHADGGKRAGPRGDHV
jgi:hypothetical protein